MQLYNVIHFNAGYQYDILFPHETHLKSLDSV